MRISFLFCRWRVVATFIVFILLLTCWPAVQTIHPCQNAGPADKVDRLVRQLYAAEGKIKYHFFIVPGGPIFEDSAPMRKLVEQGNAVQASLLPLLKDARIRNEIALILAQIGDKNALPHLIESLPIKEKLTKDEDFSTLAFLYSLGRLTGKGTGIGRFGIHHTPCVRKQWQTWYESHKNYLYSPSNPKPASWALAKILVDVEAKLAGKPTAAYRKDHPWIAYKV